MKRETIKEVLHSGFEFDNSEEQFKGIIRSLELLFNNEVQNRAEFLINLRDNIENIIDDEFNSIIE